MENDTNVQPVKPVPDSEQEPQRERKQWSEPELRRRENLPRVTNGFASSFNP